MMALVTGLALCAPACKAGPPARERSATWFCPARALPGFPEPIPSPSVEAVIGRDYVFRGDGGDKTLRQVGRRLEAVLIHAEFRNMTYMGFGCSGFAIVPDFERIGADGRGLDGPRRFALSRPDALFDLAELRQRLFFAVAGRYRQLVFLVQDDPSREPQTLATAADLDTLVTTGQTGLPYGYNEIPLDSDHTVKVLIYEFEKGEGDREVRLMDPASGLGGAVHLSGSRIEQAFMEPVAPAE